MGVGLLWLVQPKNKKGACSLVDPDPTDACAVSQGMVGLYKKMKRHGIT